MAEEPLSFRAFVEDELRRNPNQTTMNAKRKYKGYKADFLANQEALKKESNVAEQKPDMSNYAKYANDILKMSVGLMDMDPRYDANQDGVVNTQELDGANDALKWAARTYLVSAIAAVTYLAYYVLMFMGNRD